MSTQIEVWQIENGKLVRIKKTMVDAGKKEVNHLQNWILSNPEILGPDLKIIGSGVRTESGKILDLLGIDRSGNTVIIELKRDMIPRLALAQAIDYASEIANWDYEQLDEVCETYSNQSLDEFLSDNFEISEDLSINQTQRILIVGTEIEDSLQRMVEWLSDNYNMILNVILFKYIQGKNGEEFLARTVMIPETVEKERTQKQQRKIPMSDIPGEYEDAELKEKMRKYLSKTRVTPQRIRDILIPLCLESNEISRERLIKELMDKEGISENKARIFVTNISRELGIKSRDFLRQIIHYEIPEPGTRDNYSIPDGYKGLIKELLQIEEDGKRTKG